MTELLKLISGQGFVMYSKLIARRVSTNGAIIYGQLASSYESFANKGMLINIDGKEYFFLTAETIQKETSLTYRQQSKAIKELEEFGLIETKNRGIPMKKHFHLTDKVVGLFSSNKMSEVEDQYNGKNSDQLDSNYDKMSKLDMPKSQTNNELSSNSIKDNNKDKKNKINIVNKEVNNNQETIDKLILEYMKKGLSKEVCFRVLEEVRQTEGIKNFGGYLRTCLENALYKSELKKDPSKKYEELTSHLDENHPLKFNWLEEE